MHRFPIFGLGNIPGSSKYYTLALCKASAMWRRNPLRPGAFKSIHHHHKLIDRNGAHCEIVRNARTRSSLNNTCESLPRIAQTYFHSHSSVISISKMALSTSSLFATPEVWFPRSRSLRKILVKYFLRVDWLYASKYCPPTFRMSSSRACRVRRKQRILSSKVTSSTYNNLHISRIFAG